MTQYNDYSIGLTIQIQPPTDKINYYSPKLVLEVAVCFGSAVFYRIINVCVPLS